MKVIILTFALIVVTNCSQVDVVRELLKNFDYTNEATDQLRKDTENLITQTKTEFASLSTLAASSIATSTVTIKKNVDSIMDYAEKRTGDLISYLLQDIKNAQQYSADYSSCLITVPFITSLSNNYKLRTQLSLNTALRFANTTIRESALTMNHMNSVVSTFNSTLSTCAVDDMDCVLQISTKVVESNTDFVASFNLILQGLINLPQLALNQATSAANQTVYADEDYACANADLVKNCIQTYNDDEAINTTISPTSSTTAPTGTTTTPITTKPPTTPSITTQNPVTDQPAHCDHKPFTPPVFF